MFDTSTWMSVASVIISSRVAAEITPEPAGTARVGAASAELKEALGVRPPSPGAKSAGVAGVPVPGVFGPCCPPLGVKSAMKESSRIL